ncbi:glycosyltransferase family 2 protein [Bacteroidales bacterium OttesenSCG-928-M11]|nr:glycosyltransferase family 2 protein [Bacteroidales bacterium OttesenSCG-928-M11]
MYTGKKDSLFFSIVVCTYNRANYLTQTLVSIAEQTFPMENFEVLVVDNNSLDDTEETVRVFIASYPNIQMRYLREMNQGVSYCRNLGVSEARGEFIVFIDDDETVDKTFLMALYSFFKDHPEAKLCAEPVFPVYNSDKPKWLSPFTERLLTGAYYKGNKVKKVKAKDYPGTGHATFRRDLFTKYGGFKTDLGRKGSSLMGGEDKDFFLRLIEQGIDCYYIPQAIVSHYISDDKLTSRHFRALTYAIGKTERIRTRSISDKEYTKRLVSEGGKWLGSLVLFLYYTVTLHFPKGWKLLEFRWNVTRGLLKK